MHVTELIIKAIFQGGPYGVALLGWLAWWYERRQNKEQAERVLELATAQIEVSVKTEAAIEANTKLMERFIMRLEGRQS